MIRRTEFVDREEKVLVLAAVFRVIRSNVPASRTNPTPHLYNKQKHSSHSVVTRHVTAPDVKEGARVKRVVVVLCFFVALC